MCKSMHVHLLCLAMPTGPSASAATIPASGARAVQPAALDVLIVEPLDEQAAAGGLLSGMRGPAAAAVASEEAALAAALERERAFLDTIRQEPSA